MEKCKHCQAKIKSIEGRKAKEFCNPNCRNKFYYKKSREGVLPKKKGRKPMAKTEGDKINYTPTSLDHFNGKTGDSLIYDEVRKLPELPKFPSDKIAEYEAELAKLGTGTFANQRRRFLENKIKELKGDKI